MTQLQPDEKEKQGESSSDCEATGARENGAPVTLAIDIGGTGVKVLLLDKDGNAISDRAKVATPKPGTPDQVMDAIFKLSEKMGEFDRIAVGFPGVVRHGVTWTAENLDDSWIGFNLEQALKDRTGKPARAANDADVQGYGVIQGSGVEMVLTLGTGMGSALFIDGTLVPNLEMGRHPYKDSKSYEEHLGKDALEEIGKKKWNRKLQKALDEIEATFNYDILYLGGGNAKKVQLELPANIRLVSNVAGLLGGIALWRDEKKPMADPN